MSLRVLGLRFKGLGFRVFGTPKYQGRNIMYNQTWLIVWRITHLSSVFLVVEPSKIIFLI